MITKYYNALNGNYFLYFLRELEFSYNTRGLNSNMIFKELKEIFDYCASTCNYEIYDLNDFSKSGYSINLDEKEEEEDEEI